MATLDDDDKRWIAKVMGECMCAFAYSMVGPEDVAKAERVPANIDHLPEFRRLGVRMLSEDEARARRVGQRPGLKPFEKQKKDFQ